MSKNSIIEVVRNISVPRPDLESALSAIDNLIEETQRSLQAISKNNPDKQKLVDASKNGETESSRMLSKMEQCKNKALYDALEQMRCSFSSNLERFVNPVSVEEYEELLRQKSQNGQFTATKHRSVSPKGHSYIDLLEEDTMNSESSEESELDIDALMLNSSDEEDDDEDLYIDKDAILRAKELRVQVQAEAQVLQKLQMDVPQFATKLSMREIQIFRKQMEINAIDENNKHTGVLARKLFSNKNSSDENDQELDDEDLHALQKSLYRLTTSLTSIEKTMPESLDGLQQTINTIEESIQKRLNAKNNLCKLPAFDRAILSSHEDEINKDLSDHKNVGDTYFIDPKKRLSMFLAK